MVYLDVCCLNRPFDDQTQERIRLESEAVLAILFGCQMGKWYLVGSEAINYEISLTPDDERKEKVNALASLARDIIIVDKNIKKRAGNLINIGFKDYDALHLACAESVFAEVLLTTDDKLLHSYKKNKGSIKIRVDNPVIWLMEVTQSATNNES